MKRVDVPTERERVFVHELALVEARALIGEGTTVWRNAHVRGTASIGTDCTIGDGVFVDANVYIGDRVKIQNYAVLYNGLTIEDDVFIGPHVVFTNDRYPRATRNGKKLGPKDWKREDTLVKKGASIGANATIVCGVTIGEGAMVGAGSVVTKDVPPRRLFIGNPARDRGPVRDDEGEWKP
jgi:acetyltransferase-like isoleucine patch superfamily enzyme